MDLDQLSAWAEHNKVGLGIAGAGAVVLVALARRSSGSSGSAVAGSGGMTAAPAYAAGAQTAGATGGTGTAAYDSTASDLYSALQSQIEAMGASNQPSPNTIPTPAPPVASSLFTPAYTGTYVREQNGVISEVESDGSLFGLTGDQWRQAANQGATAQQLNSNPSWWSTEQNLNTAAKTATAGR